MEVWAHVFSCVIKICKQDRDTRDMVLFFFFIFVGDFIEKQYNGKIKINILIEKIINTRMEINNG